jgi:hypothetical protein
MSPAFAFQLDGRPPPTGKRGRGATERIEREHVLTRPNPAGRIKLNFSFRPLRRHQVQIVDPSDGQSKEVWGVACNLLTEYFRQIGCFRVADDATVTAWSDAVLSPSYGPKRLAWAIAAKAQSLAATDAEEQRAKRMFAAHPLAFLRPGVLDYWIERSPDGQAEAAAESRRILAGALDDLKVRSPAAVTADTGVVRPASAKSAKSADNSEFPPFVAMAISDDEQHFARQLWEAIGEGRRRRVDGFLTRNRADYAHWFKAIEGMDADVFNRVTFALRAIATQEEWPEMRKLRFAEEDAHA